MQGFPWSPSTGQPSLGVAWPLARTESMLPRVLAGAGMWVPPAASSLTQQSLLGAVTEMSLTVTALAAKQEEQPRPQTNSSMEEPGLTPSPPVPSPRSTHASLHPCVVSSGVNCPGSCLSTLMEDLIEPSPGLDTETGPSRGSGPPGSLAGLGEGRWRVGEILSLCGDVEVHPGYTPKQICLGLPGGVSWGDPRCSPASYIPL